VEAPNADRPLAVIELIDIAEPPPPDPVLASGGNFHQKIAVGCVLDPLLRREQANEEFLPLALSFLPNGDGARNWRTAGAKPPAESVENTVDERPHLLSLLRTKSSRRDLLELLLVGLK
jgi:hypothetical protein